MKPEIEQKLVEYLTALESLLKDGKDLAIEQAPEVARRYCGSRSLPTFFT